MTPEAVLASYRRGLDQTVTVRRYTGAGASGPMFEATAQGQVTGFEVTGYPATGYQPPAELVPAHGDRKAIVLAQDLADQQFPLPVQTGDKLVVRGKELEIVAVDADTRKIGDTLIAYVLQVRG